MLKWLDRGSRMAIDRMPKRISPGAHTAIDYALAAATAAYGVRCLRRNKAAGVAALMASLAEITNVAMTDAPGGVCRTISFPLHGRMDMGLSGMLAAMPKFMGFADTKESRFFYLTAAAGSLLAAMTDYTGTGERAQSRYLMRAQS